MYLNYYLKSLHLLSNTAAKKHAKLNGFPCIKPDSSIIIRLLYGRFTLFCTKLSTERESMLLFNTPS